MAVSTRTLLQCVNGVTDQLQVRATGTLTAAATATVTCGTSPFKTQRTDASSKKYEGDQIYLEAAAANVTPNPQGIALYAASTGVFTPDVAWANAPGATLVFDILLRGVSRQLVIDAINDTLRQQFYETTVPLTWVVDGDMETSGVGSWTASNATLSKVTGVDNVYAGPQSLRVLATGAAGYAQSSTIYVDPTYAGPWHGRAYVRADIGTARLIPYDVTNSAAISVSTALSDWTLRGYGIIDFTFTLPTTCEALAFRLESLASADDTYWNRLIAHPVGAVEYPAPDWLVREDQVRSVNDTWLSGYRPERDDWESIPYRLLADHSNPNRRFRIVVPHVYGHRQNGHHSGFGWSALGPFMLRATRPYSALSADTDTTFCPQDLVEAGACMEVARRMAQRQGADQAAWNVEYRNRRSTFARMRADRDPQVISVGRA